MIASWHFSGERGAATGGAPAVEARRPLRPSAEETTPPLGGETPTRPAGALEGVVAAEDPPTAAGPAATAAAALPPAARSARPGVAGVGSGNRAAAGRRGMTRPSPVTCGWPSTGVERGVGGAAAAEIAAFQF